MIMKIRSKLHVQVTVPKFKSHLKSKEEQVTRTPKVKFAPIFKTQHSDQYSQSRKLTHSWPVTFHHFLYIT